LTPFSFKAATVRFEMRGAGLIPALVGSSTSDAEARAKGFRHLTAGGVAETEEQNRSSACLKVFEQTP
jgi:hypothetical protein